MYTIVYKNGMRMRVVDKEMQKVIQSMHRAGITCVSLVRERDRGVTAFAQTDEPIVETKEIKIQELKPKKKPPRQYKGII